MSSLSLIIIFSIVAAFLNASAAVIQRYAAGHVEMEELFRRDFMKRLSKNKKWIGAFGLELVAFLFQAAALKRGSLIIVQPLMTVDLVFVMLLLHFVKKVPAGIREWLAILLVSLGLSGLLVSADPHVGTKPYELSKLSLVCLVIVGLIMIGIYIIRRTRSSNYRAGISGFAAGLSFALLAVFTKIVTGELHFGVIHVLTSWQVYGLIFAGILAIVMTQNTYGSGSVALSQPTMEIVEPLVSILLGIYLFSDSINLDPTNMTFEVISAIVAGAGIILLGKSKILKAQEI